ncbi:hypothetical protein PHYSODRAFT_504546 [Phytophthora sojae]|uniref:Uncharacterized protein n=1 Tax=Phytophthora sojae (strain P6497) TaxID=1094619 RepID=G4ZI02_PHYSP|nr:hypothetical protein PHYSODRAFT_504546 [Phytophthora sojae]EGZ17645.1 hypothetical protein PHYSODRAFT_504546 [Phytophthora sojae]|eukprot:XP_009526703.1 hypothetical protein PHYSODRAFT_504546 [Phytophthora sojae]
MEKADAFEARVVLENGAYFAYQSPSKSTCIQLSDCPNWQAAKSVGWRNLPAHWYINFFQSDNCVGNDGDVFSVARNRAIDGVHTFSSPRGIKSIYARPSNGKISWSVARKCVQLRQPVKRAELTLTDGSGANSSGVVLSDFREDISLNWFEPVIAG